MSLIKLENISFEYDNKEILDNFSLTIDSSKTTCLFGPSGCGKTTILRLIAGLETPQKGKITINGKEVSKNNNIIVPAYKREIGYVFQDLALWPHFTIYENIAFGLNQKSKNINTKNTVDKILIFFKLEEHSRKYPHQLSGGQQQLIAIARSIVLNPKILLMDEPLANLDVKLKSKILSYINEIKEAFDITIIYVTHDKEEANQISDRIVVLEDGKIK